MDLIAEKKPDWVSCLCQLRHKVCALAAGNLPCVSAAMELSAVEALDDCLLRRWRRTNFNDSVFLSMAACDC